MKKIFFVFLFVISIVTYAQEETLITQEEVVHGGFGGPVIKFITIKDQVGVLVGGRGGWIINHSFIIGGGGYGLVNKVEGTKMLLGKKMLLNFGYGGFEMEYIINWDKLIHTSFYVLIGGGAVSHRENWTDFGFISDLESDAFFILEPAFNIELNIVRFFRINLGTSYRFISEINKNNLRNSDIAGLSAVMTLKFGKF